VTEKVIHVTIKCKEIFKTKFSNVTKKFNAETKSDQGKQNKIDV
jgi:hypothetical protein